MALVPLPKLEADRVSVRLLASCDAHVFVEGVRRSGQLHGSWVQPAGDHASYDAMLGRIGSTFVPLGVFSCEDGGLAGVFNFNQIVLGFFCSAYLGYFAFAPYQKRGLMSQGLKLVLRVAFEHLGLHRLEANIQPGNRESLALVQRAGFQREGFSPGYLFIAGAWRDHERWAIRREIWRP